VVQPLTAIFPNPGDSSLLLYNYGPATPTTVTHHYVDVLPTANLKVDITPTLVARLAASKTLTRPTLSDLGPNNAYSGRVTQPLSSGGNPLLQPFTSWNYDASVEWYATRNTSFTADVFRKNFSGFLSNQTVIVPRNGTDLNGNPTVYNFYDTRPRNGNKGSVTGVEIAAQHSFSGDGLLSGFGVGANYTHVKSSQQVVSAGDCSQIEGLSKDSYNANIFYEKYGLQARVAYNWRSSYLAVCQGLQGKPQNTKAYGQMDFNLAYDITRNFQIYLEGVNITDSYNYQYSVYPNRMLLDESTGRRLLFGVRAKF
jgi:TonB-dependent receptor